MGYSLNSLNRGYIGEYIGDYYGVIKGDTRSLDYGSHGHESRLRLGRARDHGLQHETSLLF